MTADFNNFKQPICDIFSSNELNRLYEEYIIIESHWNRFFNKIDEINLVLLGEAPLNSEQFIYNPELKKDSSFLRHKDLSFISAKLNATNEDTNRSLSRLELMAELGILLVDLFPYPLDPKLHRKNFSNLQVTSKKNLFLKSARWHLDPKLKILKARKSRSMKVAYRYKRLIDFRTEYLDNFLPICIGGKAMEINKDKFYEIFI